MSNMLVSLLLSAALFMLSCENSEPSLRGTEMAPDMPTEEIALTDQHGQPFRLSEVRGAVVLTFFGFTYCPDVCPLTLSTWKKVEAELGDDAEQVKFVYITVDPERDTPEKMREHLSIFSDNFIGLTGSPEELLPVYQGYGVYRKKNQISESATGYLIDHTARINVIDKNGRWRLSFSHDAPVEDMVHDIRILLEESKTME
ncbi:MAG: SCO family protein [bacterium]